MLRSLVPLLFSASLVVDAPAKDSDPRSAILERITWEMTSWKTVEVRITQSFQFHSAFNGGHMAQGLYTSADSHLILTQDGKKMLDVKSTTKAGPVSRTLAFDDGAECARVEFDRATGRPTAVGITQLFLTEGRPEAGPSRFPGQYQFLYLGGTPIHKSLASSTYLGRSEVLGRTCGRLLLKDAHLGRAPMDLTLHFDSRTGTLLKVVALADIAGRKFEHLQWEAESIEKKQGREYVAKSRLSTYKLDADHQERVPLYTFGYAVDEIRYDHAFPLSSFRPTLVPGMQVVDKIRSKMYIVGD
ncbi:MAG: hypothetical protein P4L84_21555 [Isosphaeraceae bacterium]|nr:hypothetical protein [Isosphaeraceae bacterium]